MNLTEVKKRTIREMNAPGRIMVALGVFYVKTWVTERTVDGHRKCAHIKARYWHPGLWVVMLILVVIGMVRGAIEAAKEIFDDLKKDNIRTYF